MAAQTSMLHVRVDDQLKADAAEALAGVGLTLSDAVRILLTRVASEGGMPAGLTTDPKAYDEWFRAKVQEALKDASPATSHASAMASAQAVIDGKRRTKNRARN
jgi:DNA-damage-inducible protein J